MADLTLRLIKGSPVTFAEMDSNLLALDSDSPWKVSDGHITYHGKVGIGYGTDSNYRPKYQLDFGRGDSNQQMTIGGNADIGLHLDSSTTFTIYNDGIENVVIDNTGRIGVGITVPNQEIDVAGNIQATGTVIGNQGFFTSVYDGTMTIAGGSVFNGVNADFAGGTVTFGQLSDQTNVMIAFEVDELSGSAVILPASSAIKFSLDSEVAVLNNSLDSEHNWANNYINNVDSDARARDDSDHAWAVSEFDSLWTAVLAKDSENDEIEFNRFDSLRRMLFRIDSNNDRLNDSDHSWAVTGFATVDLAADSEHFWNLTEHNTLRSEIDSDHNWAVARLDGHDSRLDSEHAWNVARNDSDHLWAVRNFDSEHQWAVNNFDSEHFWAKAYIESTDSASDSELRKQIRIQNALNDSEHAWNVVEHAALRQDIDSGFEQLNDEIDSDHAWAVSEFDSAWRAINAIDSANDSIEAARFDSVQQYIINNNTTLQQNIDSDHAWAVNKFAIQTSLIDSSIDSEHAWNVAEHTQLQLNIDSQHLYGRTQDNLLQINIDSDHAWASANFDSEHAWNVAEHTQLRSEIDSDHAWAIANFDSEHAWNVQEHIQLGLKIDSLSLYVDSFVAVEISKLDSDLDSLALYVDSFVGAQIAILDSDLGALRLYVDSFVALEISKLDSDLDSLALYVDSFVGTQIAILDSNLDSEHDWNVIEHAKLDSNLDSEHDWNVIEHAKIESDLTFITNAFNTFIGDGDSAYTDENTDSYVDSEFVGRHQRYLHIVDPAPNPVYPGELWLDPTNDSDPSVQIWDGSTWFEFPIGGNKVSYLVISTIPPGDPVLGQLWLDTSLDANGDPLDVVKVWDGSVWFEFPSTLPNTPTVAIQASTPSGSKQGDLWMNTLTNAVNIYDGSVWFEFPGSTDSAASSLSVSDQRFKDNVITLDGTLDKVSQLRGVEFEWNTGPRQGEKDIGVIAQELETVFPELVHDKSSFGVEDAKAVDYDKLTAVLIEAVKELKDEQKQLKERIKQLENNS